MEEARADVSSGESASPSSDESLAEAARLGDETAFETILDRHRRRVVRIIARFFNSPERVEDIAQEVFAKAYFGLPEYSPNRGKSFSAWLSRIAINCCYDELRRARRRPEGSITQLTSDEATWIGARLNTNAPLVDAESSVISRDLARKLLARLSPDDRVVLMLLDGEQMSVGEIADALGWKSSKVKVRAHRARKSLRKVLGEFL